MNILEQIIEHKRREVASRKQDVRLSALRAFEYFQRAPLSLRRSLIDHPTFGIIAEFKRSSPSAGQIRKNVAPADVAREYESHGAAGISVLTDERFFSGTLDDLHNVRASVHLPILRKDFVLDEYQLFEAKAAGADAALLIATILDKTQLRDLHEAAQELGLETLVELYDIHEIEKLDLDVMNLVGVNNRDLRTFTIDTGRTEDVARLLPKGVTLVSESGITTIAELKRLCDHGIRAALIGEYLMKAGQPGKALTELLEGVRRETAH